MKRNLLKILALTGLLVWFSDLRGEGLGSYSYNNVTIEGRLPDTNEELDFDLPRKSGDIKVSDVIRASDRFLDDAFGASNSGKIASVSLRLIPNSKGERFWCWVVGYYSLEGDDGVRAPGIFFVCVSTKGEVLMRVKKQDAR